MILASMENHGRYWLQCTMREPMGVGSGEAVAAPPPQHIRLTSSWCSSQNTNTEQPFHSCGGWQGGVISHKRLH